MKRSAAILLLVGLGALGNAQLAPATTVTSTAGTFTGTIKASSEWHVVLDNPIAQINCESTIEAPISNHGSGQTVTGFLNLSFTNCTDSWHVTVVNGGSYSLHASGESGTGLLDSTGATIEVTRFGITCRYSTFNTFVGFITRSEFGWKPTLHASASIPFHSGSLLCGSGHTSLTGSYQVNTPETMFVDK